MLDVGVVALGAPTVLQHDPEDVRPHQQQLGGALAAGILAEEAADLVQRLAVAIHLRQKLDDGEVDLRPHSDLRHVVPIFTRVRARGGENLQCENARANPTRARS
jgi:hypothetical protein